jgi:hypothetical protein
MSEKVDINNESGSKHTSSKKAEAPFRDNSVSEFLDTRPENITQRKLQESANDSIQLKSITRHQQNANKSSDSNKITQLKEINSFQEGPTIQLQNKLTMHHKGMPKEKQRVGGGVGSPISTEKEVNKVISDGENADVKDSKNALDQSIEIRENEKTKKGVDAGHAHRIVQEKTWREKLQEWIDTFSQKKQKRGKIKEATDEEWGKG